MKQTGALAGSATLAGLAGCSSVLGGGKTITVSSKSFNESEILAHLAIHGIAENTDHETEDRVRMDGTTQNFQALKEGQVDMYWEYTGTAWATLPPQHSEVVTDPDELYQKVKDEFKSEHDIEVLDRADFNNTYVITANKDFVDQAGVNNMSEFAEYARNNAGDIDAVLDAEFRQREDGWPGLAEHYGFEGTLDQMNIKEVSTGLTYQIVGEGEADIGMGFNTNPLIKKFDLAVLEDNDNFFPVYNPAPFVYGETLSEASDIAKPLNDIASALNTERIRALNQEATSDESSPEEVAKSFLEEQDLI